MKSSSALFQQFDQERSQQQQADLNALLQRGYDLTGEQRLMDTLAKTREDNRKRLHEAQRKADQLLAEAEHNLCLKQKQNLQAGLQLLQYLLARRQFSHVQLDRKRTLYVAEYESPDSVAAQIHGCSDAEAERVASTLHISQRCRVTEGDVYNDLYKHQSLHFPLHNSDNGRDYNLGIECDSSGGKYYCSIVARLVQQ